MNGSKHFIQVSVVFLVFITNSVGQSNVHNNLNIKLLDQRLGLSETSNAFFFEDDLDKLWISSVDGLNRFDGQKVDVYRPKMDDEGRRFNFIVSSKVYLDNFHRYWYSTSDGIHRIDCDLKTTKSWHLFSPKNGNELKEIQLIYIDNKQDLVWIKASSGLYTTKLNDVKGALKFVHPLPKKSERHIPIKSKNGELKQIITTSLSTNYFHIVTVGNKKKGEEYSTIHIDTNNYVFNLHIERDSIAWIACSNGLYKYDLTKRKFINKEPYGPKLSIGKPPMLTDVIPYGERYLWVISYNRGLFLFDKENTQNPFVQHYSYGFFNGKKIKLDRLDKIFSGNDGTIWLANWEKGIMYFNPHLVKVNTIVLEEEMKNGTRTSVTSIYTGNDNELYFTVPSCGLFQSTFENHEWHTVLISNEILFCKKVEKLRSGQLLIADDRNIYVFFTATKKIIKIFAMPKEKDNIKDIIALKSKFVLVQTPSDLFTVDIESLKIVNDSFLPVKQINSMFKTRSDCIFFNYNTDSLVIFTPLDKSTPVNKIGGVGRVNHIIAAKENHTFWICSSLGLFKLRIVPGIELIYLGERKGEFKQALNSIQEDHFGHLWLGTNAGISQVVFKSKDTLIYRFNETDGVLDYQFTPGCAISYGNKNLFFGGQNGISSINPNLIRLISRKSKLSLYNLMINGIETGIDFCSPGAFRFNRSQRNLTFNFNTSDFIGLKDNQFKYRLYKTGYLTSQPPWLDNGNNSSVNLPGLRKGQYTLEVIASNSDGIWMSKQHPKRIHFSIQPYWYETNIFYLSLFLAFLTITYLIYRNRLARIQDRANLKETELKILRLQMNPHFIYNCLSAIQSDVLKQNIDKANSLITSFAKLMRRVLTESAKSYLTLSEETELLESYLKTESLRFENRIHYHIEIDPQLDPDEVFVPSMILQPFVENAIVHGFKKKTDTSLIKVIFRHNGAMLACIVEDNGGGLGSSVNSAHHQSKATEITSRRLELISSKSAEPASLKIINLADEAPRNTGVRVIILIPRDLKPD